jgi:excisionase family DNA binding protein
MDYVSVSGHYITIRNALDGRQMVSTTTEKLLYRPAEAADVIGVSRARAYELIAAGVIPSIKIGTSVRVPVGALREWVERQLAEAR